MAPLFLLKTLILCELMFVVHVKAESEKCPTSFECGKLGTIMFPFTYSKRPHCGVLAIHGCHDNNPNAQQVIVLNNKPNGRFLVLNIDFRTITITDLALLKSLKSQSQTQRCKAFSNNLSLPLMPSSPLGYSYAKFNKTLFTCPSNNLTLPPGFYNYNNCSNYHIYYDGFQSLGDSPDLRPPGPLAACSKIHFALKDESNDTDPFSFLSDRIVLEVELSSDCRNCIRHRRGHCQLDSQGNFLCVTDAGHISWIVKMGLGLVATVLVLVVMATLYCTTWKKENPKQMLVVDAFLEKHGPLQIRRYTYSDMKKVTNSFRDKLGQGGFGSVYKGQLQDGRHVAVKILSELKGDGEDFINEVASMSRTSHVNIVALLGFCFQGSKRALVYEFMPNGSLEKLIYEENTVIGDHQLDCQTLYNIAIGVARGLEYLHMGCNTRILHFDIKPHNILLDENFCPKISDFGLAKVCTRKESIVSIFGARGTAGYIAPEVFSRNFGAVSHKSDVYSYGMMVLEMVGRRRNIKVEVDASSELYFPHWIYNRLVSNQELGLRSIRNEWENEMVRKMTIVSLWCIQTNPSSRPSISKVVEMLEGRAELLQVPPKPFWFSPSTSP
ncbi:rust resistance kinase Lr10-like [Arachis stenosperma]|uniref:rust resistance kinase Lr10-like n=1 Tax=Arachis stenosperma TaxID=217475 RepID=UPI0025AC3A8A|nr:rust resistance kinase Lr10-like [Arachis stenosperma]